MPVTLSEVDSAQDAVRMVRQLVVAGVDAIKIFASGSPSRPANAMGRDVMTAAVAEAHRLNRPIFVHPNNEDDVAIALASGADAIAHTTPATPWRDETVALIGQRRAALTPTLSLWQHFLRHDRLTAQQQTQTAAAGQLRQWISAGGAVLFGTDFGVVDADPIDEYRLMAAAGMNAEQILASLTTEPAAFFGSSSKAGRVLPGYRADLVVVNGNPVADVAAFADVRFVIRGGRLIYRASTS
jgi:imidazolonepropionase-like amidohydrolase